MTSVPTVEDFNALKETLDDLRMKVEHIGMALNTPLTLRVNDIARLEGISRSQIAGKEAYLLPNFGVSQYPDGVKRWDVETYSDWRRIPVEKRKAMYLEYLDNQRKKAVQTLVVD